MYPLPFGSSPYTQCISITRRTNNQMVKDPHHHVQGRWRYWRPDPVFTTREGGSRARPTRADPSVPAEVLAGKETENMFRHVRTLLILVRTYAHKFIPICTSIHPYIHTWCTSVHPCIYASIHTLIRTIHTPVHACIHVRAEPSTCMRTRRHSHKQKTYTCTRTLMHRCTPARTHAPTNPQAHKPTSLQQFTRLVYASVSYSTRC